ncbi:hypothetical protein L5515_004746 [Caenorhabditis briggsae]|nr:hypothetical protein L3Y34_001911 [Caenorhabditis briggsae]UMM24578.1 hypothetical protein L5515_004746 [Caenorhabditis briggsae]
MTIKTKVSHPQKIEKDTDMTAIKLGVLFAQAFFLFIQIWTLPHIQFEKKTQLIPRFTMPFASAIVFIGFLTKKNIIMAIYIGFLTSLLAVPITTLFATAFSFFKSLEEGAVFINTEGAMCINIEGAMCLKVDTIVSIFFMSFCNLVYIAFCCSLLTDITYGNPGTLPYTSKMHKSSRDSEKLIYPKI